MNAINYRPIPKQGLVLQPLLADIKPCIAAAQTIFSTMRYALPENYMGHLQDLCNRFFEPPPEFLVNDRFLKKAFKLIHQNEFGEYPHVRNRLVPLAKELWRKKEAFEQGALAEEQPLLPLLIDWVSSHRESTAPLVMNAISCGYLVLSHWAKTRVTLVSKLQHFVEIHTHFAFQFTEELMTLNPDSAFTFQYRGYPKTFNHFVNSFLQAYNSVDSEQQQLLEEQVKASDADLVVVLVDLGILRFLQDPAIDIELFPRKEVQELSQRMASADLNALYNKIFHGKDLSEESVELEIYRDIGRMRSHLDRKRFNLLTCALFLHLSDYFLKLRSAPL